MNTARNYHFCNYVFYINEETFIEILYYLYSSDSGTSLSLRDTTYRCLTRSDSIYKAKQRRYDIHFYDIQHNDTQHNDSPHNIKKMWHSA